MRKSHLFLPLFVVLATCTVGSARAEFVCSANVSYTWTKDDITSNAEEGLSGSASPTGEAPYKSEQAQETDKPDKAAASPSPASAGATTPPGSPPAASPVPHESKTVSPAGAAGVRRGNTVRFTVIERRGMDESSAKSALEVEVQRQKLRAAERCKRAHESFGECVTTKLATKSSVLNSLSFSARTQAEKALMDECQIQQGRCLAVDASEPACRSIGLAVDLGAAAATPASEPAAPAEPAKDAKADPKKDDKGKAPAKKK